MNNENKEWKGVKRFGKEIVICHGVQLMGRLYFWSWRSLGFICLATLTMY